MHLLKSSILVLGKGNLRTYLQYGQFEEGNVLPKVTSALPSTTLLTGWMKQPHVNPQEGRSDTRDLIGFI